MGTLPRSRGLAVAILLLVVGATVAPVGAVTVPGSAPVGPAATAQPDSAEPAVVMSLQLAPNGSARWNVTARFSIRDANESAAFDRLAREFTNGTVSPGFSLATFEALAAAASNRTGRSMTIQDPVRKTAKTGRPTNGTGYLSLVFTWTHFAETTGTRIAVGDAFESWALAEDQRLVIHPPAGYGLQSVTPGTDAIRGGGPLWNGPQAFAAGEPAVIYEAGLTTTASTVSPTASTTTTDDPETGTFPPLSASFGFLLLAVVLLVAWLYWRQESSNASEDSPDTPPAGAGGADGPSGGDAAGEQSPSGETATGSGSVDPDLLSDEERVEWLLEQHDGRMRQADIVTETGWSNAKVSQLLSDMAEEGRIEKLRMGRENLISLEPIEDE